MQFKISAPDGTEYIVNGVDELKRLYHEGRIAANILVQRTGDPQWYPLNEMFNLAVWDDVTPLAPEPSYTPPHITETAAGYYGPGPSAPPLETPSIRGMRAAGCLMIAAALINIGMITLRGYHPTTGLFAGMGSGIYVGISLVDVIVGIALIYGRWRPYAMFRLCAGAFVYGSQLLAFEKHTVHESLMIFFQLIFIAGFIILLSTRFISLVRTLIGAGAIVFAQVAVGVIALVFTWPSLQHTERAAEIEKEFKPYVIQNRHFKDVESGVTLEMPDGWLLIQNDNPITKVKDARMVTVDPRDGGFAVLSTEYIPPTSSIRSTDDYIAAVLEAALKDVAWMKELKREHITFGNVAGERVEVAWEHNSNKFHGWRSVCRRGDVYYWLSCWCLEDRHDQLFPKYLELENRFTLTTFPDAK